MMKESPEEFISGSRVEKYLEVGIEEMMDCVEEDLRRASVTKFRKTSGRQRMTLSGITEDREQWRELVALASIAESSWTMKT